jgi:signal transduction histidine kinase
MNGRLVLSVHNWGTPISKEDQKKLFELYERSDSAKKSNFSGWGIGLNIARALTEAQKGFIKIESSKPLGTTFTVELPMDTRASVDS